MAIPFSYSLPRAIFFISTVLLQLLSLITVILYSLTLSFISNPLVGFSQVINFDRQSFPILQVLPKHLNTASSKLALASSVISLVVSSVYVSFTVFLWPDGKLIYPLPPMTTLISTILCSALLSFITMIYLQVTYLRSSPFDPIYRGPQNLYNKGTFDFEAWACQVSHYKSSFPDSLCGGAKVGRVMSILSGVVAIAAAAIGVWALLGEKEATKREEREKTDRKEEWVGGSSVSEEVEMS